MSKEFVGYHTGIGVENLMKTTDNGIIVHSRLRPDICQVPVSYRWNQLPRSSSFIILNVWLKTSQLITTGYRLRCLGLIIGEWRIFSFAISTSQSLFFTQACGRIEAHKAGRRSLIIWRSDDIFKCLRSNYVSPGQTQVLFCIVWWMTHRALSFARRKSWGTGRVSVWFWR